jgi:hypothetical protein
VKENFEMRNKTKLKESNEEDVLPVFLQPHSFISNCSETRMKDSFFSSLLLESLLLFGKKKTERRLGE